MMEEESPLESIALMSVRRACRVARPALARSMRINLKRLAELETRTAPPEDELVQILAAIGCPRSRYEAVLADLRCDGDPPALEPTPVDPGPQELAEIRANSVVFGRAAERLAERGLTGLRREQKASEDRAAAEELCTWLEQQAKPRLIVEKSPEVQTWAVAERLGLRSAEVALEDAGRAVQLAALACRVAELAPCEGLFRQHLLGQTRISRENAVRAAGGPLQPCGPWKESEGLWQAGAPGPLATWRTLDFEASLCRDQRQLGEALARLDTALVIAPPAARAHLLLNKVTVLEETGDLEQALALSIEAEQLVDPGRDSRLYFIARFDRAVVHSLAGRHADAYLMLHDLHKLAGGLRMERLHLKLARLAGTAAAGLGRWEDAEPALDKARRGLARRREAWEHAAVSLELAVLLCRQRKLREAGQLAAGLDWIFTESKLSSQALAALQLFREAADSSALTLDLAERALLLFQQAPKARPAAEPASHPDGRSAAPSDLAAFAAPVGWGRDHAMAAAIRVHPAAAVQGIGAGGRGSSVPEGSQPGHEPADEIARSQGAGGPAPREGWRGDGGEDEKRGEDTAGSYASNHGICSFQGRPMSGATSFLPSIMVRRLLPADLAVLTRLLMAWPDWCRREFSDASGIHPSTIGNYQKGITAPDRKMQETLALSAGIPLPVLDYFLLPAIVAQRETAGRTGDDALVPVLDQLEARLQMLSKQLVGMSLGIGAPRRGAHEEELPWPTVAEREEALDLWNQLADCSDEDRWYLVETSRDFQHRGLAELLCHESADAASDRADRALALARLACRVAELAPGVGLEKDRLVGYTRLYMSNAVRVSGDLPGAREEFLRGFRLWEAGAGSLCALAEWRVLDLEASLLRDEREFDAALRLLDQALEMAPEHAGRLLLSLAFVLEQKGEGEQAIAELRRAKPLIAREREPRHFLILRFNLATSLCLLDQCEEAEGMLPEIQALAVDLNLELHNLRVRWLTGRVAAGRGRLEEADAALDEVRKEFTTRKSAWDSSLVTLELALVRLRQNRTAEVKHLAEELIWVFTAQRIHQEALAALTLFREAAERDAATVDLTDKIVRYLRKAQSDPKLRFDEPHTR
jgi:tetratricopeptide (TPR) repeat protein